MFLPRAPPPIQFSRLNRRNSMSDRKREYVPSVKMVDDEIKYFVLFNEKSNGLIERSEEHTSELQSPWN